MDFHETGLVARTASNTSAPSNPQTLNRYSYVQNNPLRYVDPTGHCRDANGEVDESCSEPNIPGYDPTYAGKVRPGDLQNYFPKRYLHDGGTNELRDLLNWPKNDADEASRLEGLNDSDLDRIEAGGLTPDEVDKIAQGYEDVGRENPYDPATGKGNRAAGPRARYLREVAKRLRARAAERERKNNEENSNQQYSGLSSSYGYAGFALAGGVALLITGGMLGGRPALDN